MTRTLEGERTGLRERKKLRTERDLRAAALRLFTKWGFDGVTIDDIADAADVSKRTFYRYFDSKEDVILDSPEEHLDEIRAALALRPADEPILTSMRQAISAVAGDYEEERELMKARALIMRDTPSLVARSLEHQERLSGALAELIAERLDEAPDELAPRLLAAHVTTTLRLTVEHWLDAGGDQRLSDLIDGSMRLLEQGFPRAPGNHTTVG